MKKILLCLSLAVTVGAYGQNDPVFSNTGKNQSFHCQATMIPQYHFNFKAPYSGTNSLLPKEPVLTSFTTTLFASYKAFIHTYVVFNPEAAGGRGLSQTLGLAGFPNGEVYRVGD